MAEGFRRAKIVGCIEYLLVSGGQFIKPAQACSSSLNTKERCFCANVQILNIEYIKEMLWFMRFMSYDKMMSENNHTLTHS